MTFAILAGDLPHTGHKTNNEKPLDNYFYLSRAGLLSEQWHLFRAVIAIR